MNKIKNISRSILQWLGKYECRNSTLALAILGPWFWLLPWYAEMWWWIAFTVSCWAPDSWFFVEEEKSEPEENVNN